VEPGHLHAEQFHADGHGAHDHGHEDHDEADQPTRLVFVSDGAADQDHNGEADRGPSHMREHKLLLRVRPGFRLLSERPNRTREGKRPSLVSDVPRPVLRGRGPLVSHP